MFACKCGATTSKGHWRRIIMDGFPGHVFNGNKYRPTLRTRR